MADSIMITGDMLRVTMPIMGATVFPLLAPQALVGSGERVNALMRPICLQGDELPPYLKGVPLPYVSGSFTIPGTGMLQIILMPNNLTKRTNNAGKPILLKGGTFQAKFQVVSPAMMPAPPAPPVPDPILTKIGSASFITTNYTVKAS